MEPELARRKMREECKDTADDVRALQEELKDAVARRDQAFVKVHGEAKGGLLSYNEIAEASGLARGRVIQIVQAKRG